MSKKKQPTVAALIKRSKAEYGSYSEQLAAGEKMLSFNKVTGYSLNFPIAQTCKPSAVCVKTCYFARGGSAWPASLKKQHRLLNSVKASPESAANRLDKELGRLLKKKPSFLRWNGGGDLFPESVEMINCFAKLQPDLPIWVVTRMPELAAQIKQASNVFIHFSLDSSSLERRERFESLDKKSGNYFYSYQCDKNETPTRNELQGISVLFYDRYIPPEKMPSIKKEIICPLNLNEDITNVCDGCRRCFDSSAVSFYKRGKPVVAQAS